MHSRPHDSLNKLKFWPILIVLAGLAFPQPSQASGTWVALNNQAPDDIDTMLLLPNGTVMGASSQESANKWYLLTPDSSGSYINGSWSTLAPMNYSRLYYSSQVLTNGNVFVAGGEYGSGSNSAEIYNPQANTWTVTPPPPAGQVRFDDSISEILSNGNVLVAPVTPATYGGTVIYVTASNLFIPGPTLANNEYYQDEASWVKLPDNSILAIDPFGTNSERYIPSLNKWVSDTNVPVEIYDQTYFEMGPAFLLPNGKAIFAGGTGNTALYTPSGTTNVGMWQAGPVLPNSQVAADAPGAMMVNGKVLYTTSSAFDESPTYFYEYDPLANLFTEVDGPAGQQFDQVSYVMRMLDLPDGTVLFADTGPQLYVYQPNGSPLAAGQPVIDTLTSNGDGSYRLTGTLFNGITEGAAYGDDAQMNSNYPLVRMTNNFTGQVYYARTYGWNSTGVMTGTNIISTRFVLPGNVPYGIYSLVVSANGNASAPVSFPYSPDTLLVIYTNSLFFSGTNSGPFAPTSISLMLTNVGVSSLNWSVGYTSSWVNVSSGGGALTPGGPVATVNISLNTGAVDALPVGTYPVTLWFTNTTDHFVQSETLTLVVYPQQLVQNGGFETDDFTDWTLAGVMDGYEFVYDDSSYAHSGNDCAVFEPQSGFTYLSQTIPTSPGQAYLVSFWLLTYDSVTPSQFSVSWAGTNIENMINVQANYQWTQMQYLVTAKSASSTLQFSIEYPDDGSSFYLGLDDISVTGVPVPSFRPLTKANGSVQLTWGAMYGQAYQLQYATNLTEAVWTNVGNPITASSATISVTNTAPAGSQAYYRLMLSP